MLSPPSKEHNAGDRFQWSDSSLQPLFEEAIDALLLVNRQGICLEANASACALIGLPRQRLIHASLTTWMSLSNYDLSFRENISLSEWFEAGQESSRSNPVEIRLQPPDGEEHRVLLSAQWAASERGYLVVLQDITQRCRADAQLQAIAQSLQRSSESSLSVPSGFSLQTEKRNDSLSQYLNQDVFRALFEKIGFGMFLCSIEGTILQTNAKSKEIFGCSESELVRHHLKEFVVPEDLMLALQYLEELVMGDRTSFDLETRYVRPDGTSLWYRISVIVSQEEAGQSWTAVASIEDISFRRELETALKESESLMDSVINSAAACIVRYRCFGDRSFVYEYCSEGAETVFSYTAQEFLANPTLWAEHVHPQDYQRMMRASFEHIFKEQNFKAEYRFRAKDGSQRWISTTMSSQLDLDNNCWHVTTVDVDISDRKQAELEIEESRRRYQDLVNSTEGIVWAADAQTLKFTFVSEQAESLLGYPLDQWMNEPNFWANHIHPEDREWAVQYCLAETRQCSDHDFEYRMIAADGRVVWLRDLVTVHSEAGVPIYLRGLMVDITVQKEAEASLRQYERIVSITPDGVALLDQHYMYQIVNQTYLDWHQKTEDEVLGHSVSEVLGRDIFEQKVKPRLERALAGELVRYQDWFEFELLGRQYLDVTYVPYGKVQRPVTGVVALIRNLTDLKQAEIAIQRLAERELLLVSITNHIRRSLDLDTVLDTTVTEVRKILQVDRVLVYRFEQEEGGQVIAESVGDSHLSILGYHVHDPCLANKTCMVPYEQGKIQDIEDIHASKLTDCYVDMLSQLQVRANLVLPILHDNQLWGLLVAQHCTQPRYWDHEEIDLLKQLTVQLAIAIQQSELYEQVQHLNDNLELEVEERTAELRQSLEFEAMLKRITDKVRDSLDESQILQTVVEELAQGLEVECCDTGIYNADRTQSTITHEVVRSMQSALGRTFAITESCHAEIYPSLFQGQPCHFCDMEAGTFRSDHQRFTVLACPIVDDQQTIGDLWLFRPSSDFFNEVEIRLVQQVANQCAIALRQARLYQSAQSQVVELERLNRLKDDFLSTVSHELRTPMATIKMATQMVEMQLDQLGILHQDEHSILNRYVQILRDECQQETNLINNLLDLTRLDSDTEPLILTTIDLQNWIAHIAESVIPQMEIQHQTFRLDIPSELNIEVDLAYLERIVTELLNNACKYTPAGEQISITARSRPGLIRLTVSNSGVDIPQAECDRIFDKFYRIPNNDPWKHGGTGLGLALVKKLAGKLNATVRAESHDNQLHLIVEFYVPQMTDSIAQSND